MSVVYKLPLEGKVRTAPVCPLPHLMQYDVQ